MKRTSNPRAAKGCFPTLFCGGVANGSILPLNRAQLLNRMPPTCPLAETVRNSGSATQMGGPTPYQSNQLRAQEAARRHGWILFAASDLRGSRNVLLGGSEFRSRKRPDACRALHGRSRSVLRKSMTGPRGASTGLRATAGPGRSRLAWDRRRHLEAEGSLRARFRPLYRLTTSRRSSMAATCTLGAIAIVIAQRRRLNVLS